jgi:ABC-type phosphate transport system substrate-binding protein
VTFRIGTDAIIVVVSDNSNFIHNLSMDELKKVFTTATKWSDIHPEWPDEDIKRFVPAMGSGSFNLFSEIVLGGESQKLSTIPNFSWQSRGHRFDSDMLHTVLKGLQSFGFATLVVLPEFCQKVVVNGD